jgi:hypothetical protein
VAPELETLGEFYRNVGVFGTDLVRGGCWEADDCTSHLLKQYANIIFQK